MSEEIRFDPRNARRHPERNKKLIRSALEEVGPFRSIAIDGEGIVRAGNGVLEQARVLGLKLRVVDAGPDELIAVRRPDLVGEKAERAALLDNRAGDISEWDLDTLAWLKTNEPETVKGLWDDTEWNRLLGIREEKGTGKEEVGQEQEMTAADVPDAIWPTDNDWGIPLLDINLQANALDSPFVGWGTGEYPRKSKMKGTWHFYTEDYRFEALWGDPSPVLNTGAASAVEPNFSCYIQMPPAVALYQVYRKRWIARWWQSFGLRIFADLNVAEPHYPLNLLGIPKGWKAWATRGYNERTHLTEAEYEMACEHAGTSSILFVVYGGGQKVKSLCKSKGWLWFDELMHRKESGEWQKDQVAQEEAVGERPAETVAQEPQAAMKRNGLKPGEGK